MWRDSRRYIRAIIPFLKNESRLPDKIQGAAMFETLSYILLPFSPARCAQVRVGPESKECIVIVQEPVLRTVNTAIAAEYNCLEPSSFINIYLS